MVGYVPRTISTPCNLFIRKGCVITCIISGHRQYSLDLELGDLDVPCKLQFQADNQTTIYIAISKIFEYFNFEIEDDFRDYRN